MVDAVETSGRLLGADQAVDLVDRRALEERVQDVAADGAGRAGQELVGG